MEVAITVIIPSLNVYDYIDECLRSVINQTFSDIEILCIDAGSTDGTVGVLHQYEQTEKRIRIIESEKRSYGYQVNLGISEANGKYIAIIESDDFVEATMLEKLYMVAAKDELDYVKANYDCFIEYGDERVYDTIRLFPEDSPLYDKVLIPKDRVDIYRYDYSIWRGIYRADFLRKNGICCNETKGAAFQDIGFLMQVYCMAQKAEYITDSLYRYRMNREGASSLNDATLMYVMDEYRWLIEEKNMVLKKGIALRMCDCFLVETRKVLKKLNYEEKNDLIQIPYRWLQEKVKEFIETNVISKEDFIEKEWNELLLLLENINLFSEYVKNQEELLKGRESIISELPTGLYRWYSFIENKKALYVGEDDTICNMLRIMKCLRVYTSSPLDLLGDANLEGEFQYIILSPKSIENAENLSALISRCKDYLVDNGIIMFGIHNRYGIRYFCGDKDPYTEGIFDGIVNYVDIKERKKENCSGRCYDSVQIETIIDDVGMKVANRYSVFNGLENPSMLLASGYYPNEQLSSRVFPQYIFPGSVFIEEQKQYDYMKLNKMLHQLANAYLFECVKKEQDSETIASNILQVTSSIDRGVNRATITIIQNNGKVVKMAAFKEGKKRIRDLAKNIDKLRARGIDVIDGYLENDKYVMPYIDAETGEAYLKRLMRTNIDDFLVKLDEFYSIILKSSDQYEGTFELPIFQDETAGEILGHIECDEEIWKSNSTVILKEAMLDLVPLNCFYLDGKFVFFDQEICEKNYPADYIMHRTILIAHTGLDDAQKVYDIKKLFDRYGMPGGTLFTGKKNEQYYDLDNTIIRNLRNERLLSDYYRKVRSTHAEIVANRHQINHAHKDYTELFEEIFFNIGTKKLIIFGAGKYARIFLTRYGKNYPVIAAIDNAKEKWGSYLYAEGYELTTDAYGKNEENDMQRAIDGDHCVKVVPPSYLHELKYGEYRVIVCIRDYNPIVQQLEEMEIYDYAIYNPMKQYSRELRPIRESIFDNVKVDKSRKKYHIGYTAGAFDMFHTGHVNLLRRSKEMCDYLIVGIMSDEAIRDFKGKEPCISYEDRAAVVASCRYVDEVVEIPYMRGNSDEAWKMYHFDVQFCGSDYVGNVGRMKEKEFLEAHGATLVMFPYTEHISSSMIRGNLKKNMTQE